MNGLVRRLSVFLAEMCFEFNFAKWDVHPSHLACRDGVPLEQDAVLELECARFTPRHSNLF
jgi:hypothetical protein